MKENGNREREMFRISEPVTWKKENVDVCKRVVVVVVRIEPSDCFQANSEIGSQQAPC